MPPPLVIAPSDTRTQAEERGALPHSPSPSLRVPSGKLRPRPFPPAVCEPGPQGARVVFELLVVEVDIGKKGFRPNVK